LYLKKKYNLLFLGISLFIFLLFSNSFAASILPELKKSINYQCKNDDSYKSIKQCRSDVLGDLSIQGTDFIYRVQDKDIRKDMVLQCNFERKNAIKFNACLFEQVAIFFEEDTTIPPPVIIETEKNSNDDLVSIVTPPDSNEISLIERLINSTFFVESKNKIDDYDYYIGSAVKINKNELLTACHVVYNDDTKQFYKNIFVSNVSHKDKQKKYKAIVKEYDLNKDACIIGSNDIANYPSVPNIRDFEELKVYEKVYGIGNPNGFVGRTVEGKITSLYKSTPLDLKYSMKIGDSIYDPGELIETNAPMDQGNSGGGLYDSKGNLIGILSMCIIEPGAQCRYANPINFSIPSSSFKNLTEFDVENDFNPQPDNDLVVDLDNDANKNTDEYERNDYWIYNRESRILSTSENDDKSTFDLQYYWSDEVNNCYANMIVYHVINSDSDLNIFKNLKDSKFSFKIFGKQPLDLDIGYISSVSEEYMDVPLVLLSESYEKNMFNNKFNTDGNLMIQIKSDSLIKHTKKKFYFFNNTGLDNYSNRAYDYCMTHKSAF
tara:strand:- start:2238 stop:3881 length:1644 start_codon:yes stop_codon:yes gene_type:complete